jgi:molybdopterin-binding protein
MKLSARNLLKGKVVKIVHGAVNAEVTLQLTGGEQIDRRQGGLCSY